MIRQSGDSGSAAQFATGLRRRRRREGGITLSILLVLLIIFGIIAGGVMTMVSATIRSAAKRTDQVEAFNMADAGIDLGVAWLTQQSTPPDSTTLRTMTTNFYGTNGTISAPFGQTGTTLTVKIYSDTINTNSTQKKYLIESKSVMPSGASQIARAYIRQDSFGKYAFFTVNDGDGYWQYDNHFEGPFHSNDADGKHSMFIWKQNYSGGPMFTYTGSDAFSVSGDPTWWKDTYGNVQAPTSTTDFNSIASGGQSSMTYGYKTDASGNFLRDSSGNKIPNSPQIALPSTSYAQQYAALGLTAPNPATSPSSSAPTAAGVTLYSSGGIYIHNDSAVALSVDILGNQVITVTQPITSGGSSGTLTQAITVNRTLNTTTMVTTRTVLGIPVITTSLISGTTNGMIYSDGNVTSLSGTIADNTTVAGSTIARNQWTLATDVSGGKDITISGSIKYNTARDLTKAQSADTNFNTKAGILGILGNDVVVKDGAPATIEIDASIFCTGTFKAANPGNPPASSNATMTSVGGVIVNTAGIFAQGDSSGKLVSGYNEQYHYDQRLADYPPPFFPTTGSHYKVVSWQNSATTIQ